MGMTNTKTEVAVAKKQVAQTMHALNTLTTNRNRELRPLYDDLRTQIKALSRQAQVANSRATKMKSESSRYFAQWDNNLQQLKSPEIRQHSINRKQKAMKSYNQVITEMEKLSAAYRPLMSDLKDIETHLSFDLNPNGVKAMSSLVKKANNDASKVNMRIDSTIAELSRASKELSSNSNASRS